MVWQPRANCWVYHPITNGLYWPKGSAKFANLEQNALKHFLTSAEGRVEGNMFFLYYFFVFPTCFFLFHTVFFPKTGTFRNAFFPPFCFVLFLFSPQQQKKRVFPQQRKNMFLSKPNPCRRRRENLLCFNYSFWRSGFSKKTKKKKGRKELRKKEVGCTPCVKSAGFFFQRVWKGGKKQSLRVCLETPQNPR